jgi:hypothetical protein
MALALRGSQTLGWAELRGGAHTQKDRSRRGNHPSQCQHELFRRLKRTHPVTPIEDTREAPGAVLERLDIHDLDEQNVARGSTLDLEGPGEVVDPCQIDVPDIVGRVIVLDLAAGPACGQLGC